MLERLEAVRIQAPFSLSGCTTASVGVHTWRPHVGLNQGLSKSYHQAHGAVDGEDAKLRDPEEAER